MPKDLVGRGARVVQEERRMCAVVAGSSRPERALKNEVFRLCETMSPKEMGTVLGKVYVRLGARERTASMAEYMKDLYGSGSRRLFAPKPIVGDKLKLKVKPMKAKEGLKLALVDGSVVDVPMVGVGRFSASINSRSGGRRKVPKALAKARTMAVTGAFQSPKVAASADMGSVAPSGVDPNNVVSLESVANYCLHTAELYSEVKPVYDMLLELYSKSPTTEWLNLKEKIRKRMDTLPKGGYTMIVTGDFVENKQIANNVETVEAEGVGVIQQSAPKTTKTDGRKRPTRTGKIVPAVYEYKYLKEDEEGARRLTILYQLLLAKGWIDDSTTPEMFMRLFNGIPNDIRIKWMGTQADLYALIKNLCDKELITCPKGATRWVIAKSHFVNSNSVPFGDFNRQKENVKSKDTVSYFVDVLNPAIPLDKKMLKLLGIA